MILLIDSYDSFTNNLSQLVKDTTGKQVITIHNDTFKPDEYEFFLGNHLPNFEYIVIGPGPGHPENECDIGIIRWLLQKFKENPAEKSKIPPILGICLGFQSICHEFDNKVLRLEDIKHGQVYNVIPTTVSDLFPDVQPFPSVRYHSLYVEIDTLDVALEPLAYCEDNGSKILMAAKHKTLPFYGVQYHPESICSENGKQLVENFDKIAATYNERHSRTHGFGLSSSWIKQFSVDGGVGLIKSGKLVNPLVNSSKNIYFKKFTLNERVSPIGICDYFNQNNKPFFLLNSASTPGEWSIIGLPTTGKSEVITHSLSTRNWVNILQYGAANGSDVPLDDDDIWSFVGEKFKEKFIPRHQFPKLHSRDIPFMGGFLGIVSYEEGQHIVIEKLESMTSDGKTPDLKLVYIERFLVLDHKTNEWFIISINQEENDKEWCEELCETLTSSEDKLIVDTSKVPQSVKDLMLGPEDLISVELPSKDIYHQQFEKCQDYLHSGDSYELCLTTQLKIRLPAHIKSWEIYKILTIQKNPSPFSCFMEFEDVTLISSSPERFLSWKDEGSGNKMVELRPIKGTVKKSEDMTFEKATKILKTPKEMGENLMIVDLIRHDLHKFIEKVTVNQLMTVEEYKTVYQLVSVIRGELTGDKYNGLDILKESLPPGSMTGAPKKRSVELLQEIEELQATSVGGGRRGVYSGVIGYWSVTDDSDWSVIIRSVFHYAKDKENEQDKINIWRIGAGGAITVLSECESEWEEMEVKLSSALQAFR